MGFGKARPACPIRVIVGLGKGQPLPGSPLRRAIEPAQARAAVAAAADTYFPGWTATATRGVWKREGEPSLAIDVLVPADRCAAAVRAARCLAADLRSVLRQQAVLVAHRPPGGDLMTEFVTARTRPGRCAVGPRARRAATAAARKAIL